ncbi:division plane positioning ATPase MipZ [Actinomyces lilanjuaniae]|uniref:division plane positioning ATPase MipZ n=1 Tax=Actinomyces lilanjuaniae TaxID=2321394 RepID=UPI0019694EA8|nr:division plane positioning ATPase MipZ [Actinomyces lilanjuaniae]
MTRWGGAGYAVPDTASVLAGGEPSAGEGPAEGVAAPPAGPAGGSGAPAGPSPEEGVSSVEDRDRWRSAAQEMGRADTGRHELPGAWRRVLRRVSLGAYRGLEPEAAWRHRVAVNRALAPMPDTGAGTVVVAQPKGGVGKSPVAVLVACGLEAYTRRTPVLWDCNENAGARWAVGRFDRTVEHLLGEPERGTVLTQVEAAAIDQDEQAYQVVAAPRRPRNLSDEEFAVVHSKLAQRFTQVVIDTGNTVTAANLVNAVARADVVVVPTDHATATMAPTLALFEVLEARWGRGAWSRRVVGVETGLVEDPDPEWREFFASSCAEVVEVPWDPHIAARGRLLWSRMAPGTREACLHLAGAVTDVYRSADDNNHDGGVR